jgi:hypothetical protein
MLQISFRMVRVILTDQDPTIEVYWYQHLISFWWEIVKFFHTYIFIIYLSILSFHINFFGELSVL